MNPKDLYEFLTYLLQQGPAVAASGLIGVVLGALGYRKLFPKDDSTLRADLARRTDELVKAQADLAGAQQRFGAAEKERDDAVREGEQAKEKAKQALMAAASWKEQWTQRNNRVAGLKAELAAANLATKAAEQERDAARDEARTAASDRDAARAAASEAGRERDNALAACDDLQTRLEDTIGERETFLADRDRFRRYYNRARKKVRETDRATAEAIATAGRVWERPLASGAVPFRPLSERGCPIIAVLNLKGGVGKTTLTLNLAARLATAERPVLVMDLDHQRTLSTLTLKADDRLRLHQERRTLQHFLLGPDRTGERLASFAHPVQNGENLSLVINTSPHASLGQQDSLEEIEQRLHAEWLINRQGSDARLFLRQALHSPAISGSFGHVLLDCPPRLSPSCINAIAACDYVLVPILLDQTSTYALVYLLRELRRYARPGLFPHVRVIGVVANRVHGGAMTGKNRDLWNSLRPQCRDAWGASVHLFDAVVRQSATFNHTANVSLEDGHSPLACDADATLGSDFQTFADEILERITHESQQPASVLA